MASIEEKTVLFPDTSLIVKDSDAPIMWIPRTFRSPINEPDKIHLYDLLFALYGHEAASLGLEHHRQDPTHTDYVSMERPFIQYWLLHKQYLRVIHPKIKYPPGLDFFKDDPVVRAFKVHPELGFQKLVWILYPKGIPIELYKRLEIELQNALDMFGEFFVDQYKMPPNYCNDTMRKITRTWTTVFTSWKQRIRDDYEEEGIHLSMKK